MPGAARAVLLIWKAWARSGGFRVELDGHLVNLDWLEGPGNEHKGRLWNGGTRHGDGRVRAAR
jgi:hypothetical protein